MNKYTFVMILLWMIILSYLIYQAVHGNNIAIAVIGGLIVLFLICVGLSFGAGFMVLSAKLENARFSANMKENLMITAQTQRTMAVQNKTLLGENQVLRKQLPEPGVENNFIIEDGIFDEVFGGDEE